MTDRANALIVVLERDTRDDDIQSTVDAIKQLRGVADVQLNIASPGDMVAEVRARQDLIGRLLNVIQEFRT